MGPGGALLTDNYPVSPTFEGEMKEKNIEGKYLARKPRRFGRGASVLIRGKVSG